MDPKLLRTAIILLLVLLPSIAEAQGSEIIAQARRDARMRFGPFLFDPSLVVDQIGVDDNVLLDQKTGQPQSDLTATLTPGLRVRLPVAQRALLTVDVATGLVWYKEFADERSANPSLGGNFEIFVGKITFQGGVSYARSTDRPSLEIDRRSLHRVYNFSGGVRYRVRPKLEFGFNGSDGAVRFGEEEEFNGTALRETMNRRTTTGGAEVRQTLTPKTQVTLSAVIERTKFDFSPERDVSGFRVVPGVEFAATALISGRAHIGYRRLERDNSALGGFSGVIAAVELSHRLREATTLTVGWNRDLQFSYQLSRPHYTSNQWMARVRRQIAGQFDTRLTYRRTYHDYPDFPITEAFDPARELTQSYSADIGYRLNRHARIGLGLIGADRTSTSNPSRVYEQLRWGFNLSYGSQ